MLRRDTMSCTIVRSYWLPHLEDHLLTSKGMSLSELKPWDIAARLHAVIFVTESHSSSHPQSS